MPIKSRSGIITCLFTEKKYKIFFLFKYYFEFHPLSEAATARIEFKYYFEFHPLSEAATARVEALLFW